MRTETPRLPSPRERQHRADVARYAAHHGRLLTALYDWRRLLLLVVVILPPLLYLAWAIPVLGVAWTVVLVGEVVIRQARMPW